MRNFFFVILFTFSSFLAGQTYVPVDGKVVISVSQETPDGGEIVTTSGKIDSLEAANRFFQTIVATNQRIAELRVEIELLEVQVNQSVKAFDALSGQSSNQKLADLYSSNFLGDYTIVDSTSRKNCQIILNNQGRLVLRVGTTSFPLKVMSNKYFTIANLGNTAIPFEFIERSLNTWVYSERGRKIVLIKK